jgi:MFS transporter, Spinster family, sphingosine-1-phosphate transporter
VEGPTVFISYATISVTGPVIGIVFGGNLTTYFGGYTSKLVLKTALYVALSCAIVAIPIPFISNFILFCILLWFLLFFGGSVLPCLTGIMLNTVDQS